LQSGETAGLGIFYPKGYNNMWHVILQILAVIGIVLLVLLALALLGWIIELKKLGAF
jgi:hypothetical protein